MKLKSIVVVLSLALVPLAVAAQSSLALRTNGEVEPPRLESVAALSG